MSVAEEVVAGIIGAGPLAPVAEGRLLWPTPALKPWGLCLGARGPCRPRHLQAPVGLQGKGLPAAGTRAPRPLASGMAPWADSGPLRCGQLLPSMSGIYSVAEC